MLLNLRLLIMTKWVRVHLYILILYELLWIIIQCVLKVKGSLHHRILTVIILSIIIWMLVYHLNILILFLLLHIDIIPLIILLRFVYLFLRIVLLYLRLKRVWIVEKIVFLVHIYLLLFFWIIVIHLGSIFKILNPV